MTYEEIAEFVRKIMPKTSKSTVECVKSAEGGERLLVRFTVADSCKNPKAAAGFGRLLVSIIKSVTRDFTPDLRENNGEYGFYASGFDEKLEVKRLTCKELEDKKKDLCEAMGLLNAECLAKLEELIPARARARRYNLNVCSTKLEKVDGEKVDSKVVIVWSNLANGTLYLQQMRRILDSYLPESDLVDDSVDEEEYYEVGLKSNTNMTTLDVELSARVRDLLFSEKWFDLTQEFSRDMKQAEGMISRVVSSVGALPADKLAICSVEFDFSRALPAPPSSEETQVVVESAPGSIQAQQPVLPEVIPLPQPLQQLPQVVMPSSVQRPQQMGGVINPPPSVRTKSQQGRRMDFDQAQKAAREMERLGITNPSEYWARKRAEHPNESSSGCVIS